MAPRLKQIALRLAYAAALLAPSTGLSFAEDAPKLPPTATQLSGPAIVKLYDGKTFTFQSFTFFGVATGEVSYDFSANTNHVVYKLGFHKGTIEGNIRVNGDKFCYSAGYGNERCNTVFVDGKDIYEVRGSGTIDSVKQEASATPPA